MKYSKGQRVMAWIGIACLLLLYLVSILLGIFGSKTAFPLFMASLLATFFIPAMIYIFQLILKNAKERRYTGENQMDRMRKSKPVSLSGKNRGKRV